MLLTAAHVNYINVADVNHPVPYETSGDAGITCYRGVPLHVTALGLPGLDDAYNPVQLSRTDLADSDPNAAIKARWQWDFGDDTGASEFNSLEGFTRGSHP